MNNKAGISVILTTIYLLIYAMTPSFGWAFDLIFALFVVGNLLVLWMVYSVLKHGKDPGKKWSEGHWYDDLDRQFSKNA